MTSSDLSWIPSQLAHQQSCILNKMQHYVDWDLMINTRVHVSPEMTVPEFCKTLTITQHVQSSLLYSAHLFQVGLPTNPNFYRYHFKWQCSSDSPVTDFYWFPFSHNRSPVLLSECPKIRSPSSPLKSLLPIFQSPLHEQVLCSCPNLPLNVFFQEF